jgi:hypothetical protein
MTPLELTADGTLEVDLMITRGRTSRGLKEDIRTHATNLYKYVNKQDKEKTVLDKSFISFYSPFGAVPYPGWKYNRTSYLALTGSTTQIKSRGLKNDKQGRN